LTTDVTDQPCTYHGRGINRPEGCTAPVTHVLWQHGTTKFLCAEAAETVTAAIAQRVPCTKCRQPRWLHWDLMPINQTTIYHSNRPEAA
jgi:hypothetical protein